MPTRTIASVIATALAAAATLGGCRFGDETWDGPDAGDYDASAVDNGWGFACPEPDDDWVYFNNADSPYVGGEDTIDLVVADFSFFKCPHCADFARLWESVFADRPEFRSRVRFYFHHYPFDYDSAWELHAAAVAAGNQGMENFWALHDYLFSGIYNDGVYYSIDSVRTYCQDVLQLDMVQFEEDLASSATMSFLAWDKGQGLDAGVGGTPSVFVCGKKLSQWSQIEAVLDGYLETTDTDSDSETESDTQTGDAGELADSRDGQI